MRERTFTLTATIMGETDAEMKEKVREAFRAIIEDDWAFNEYLDVVDSSEEFQMPPISLDLWGFTPNPNCDNCDGTGIFSTGENGDPSEPCAFCLEDAIKRGEIDGQVDGVNYVGGQVVRPDPGN